MKSLFCTLRSRGFTSVMNGGRAVSSLHVQRTTLARSFHSSPFTWNNNDGICIRVNESVVAVEQELSTILKENELSDTSYDEMFQLKKDVLTGHGLELIEGDFRTMIKGTKEGRKFSIEWDVQPQEANEDDEDYGEGDYENEDDKEPDDDDDDKDPDEVAEQLDQYSDDDDDPPPVIIVDVKIEKEDGSTIRIECGANQDGQLLVYRMGTPDAKYLVVVSDLSEEVQHKIYDYLEGLGIGDGTARFINDYVQYHGHKQHQDTLRYVCDFFSK